MRRMRRPALVDILWRRRRLEAPSCARGLCVPVGIGLRGGSRRNAARATVGITCASIAWRVSQSLSLLELLEVAHTQHGERCGLADRVFGNLDNGYRNGCSQVCSSLRSREYVRLNSNYRKLPPLPRWMPPLPCIAACRDLEGRTKCVRVARPAGRGFSFSYSHCMHARPYLRVCTPV